MKKLMIAAAIVCAATMSQAAVFTWTTSSKLYGVTSSSVVDNDTYASASSGTTDRGDKALSGLGYTLTLFLAGEQVGQATGTIGYGSLGKVGTSGISIDAAAQGTAYDYTFVLSGDQTSLSGRGKVGDYDYSDAIVTASYSGKITTEVMGATELGLAVPSEWTVSGITKEEPGPGPEPTPEPTSGLLMLLGMAGLALRRKQK